MSIQLKVDEEIIILCQEYNNIMVLEIRPKKCPLLEEDEDEDEDEEIRLFNQIMPELKKRRAIIMPELKKRRAIILELKKRRAQLMQRRNELMKPIIRQKLINNKKIRDNKLRINNFYKSEAESVSDPDSSDDDIFDVCGQYGDDCCIGEGDDIHINGTWKINGDDVAL